jgi:transposase InsO family protein
MFARMAHLTFCYLVCSHSKQHKVENSHGRHVTKDGESQVLDLFSRRIVGWLMGKNTDRHFVLRALMMAVWKR